MEYVEKLQADLTSQQKEAFNESETLSNRGSELVQFIQSNVGAISTCNSFITEDTPEDDQHRVKLAEIQEQDGQARTELAQIRSRLNTLVQLNDTLRGSLGILQHLTDVNTNGIPAGEPVEDVAETLEEAYTDYSNV